MVIDMFVPSLCSGCKQRNDYGKSITQPTPPLACQEFSSFSTKMFERWWAFKVLSRIPDEDHDEVMLKAAAFDCLGGKRKNWALQTRWRGNYLAETEENSQSEVFKRNVVNRFTTKGEQVLFSSFAKKVNMKFKVADRIVVVTTSAIIKLDNKYKVMKTIPLDKVTGVTLTPGDDQLLVIHLQHNDLVICLFNESKANRVAELMANLYLQIYDKSGKMLNVRVDSQVKCELGKKAVNLTVKNGPANSAMTFKRVGNNDLTLLWPESG